MPIPLNIDVEGAPRAKKAIKAFVFDDEGMKEVAPKVHDALLRWQKRGWESEGAAMGERWPRYTGKEAAYFNIKQNILGSKMVTSPSPILRWEKGRERLKPSLTKKGHTDQKFTTRSNKWVFESVVPYAEDHHTGQGKAPSHLGGHQVKRRILMSGNTNAPSTRILVADIARIIREWAGLGT